MPVIVLLLTLLAWQIYVTVEAVPVYILPSPTRIATALFSD